MSGMSPSNERHSHLRDRYNAAPRGSTSLAPPDTKPQPERLPSGGSERPRTIRLALEHLNANRFAETADLAQRLIAQQPADIEALLLLALALGGQGELERAVLLLTKVGRERPNHAHPCADLAGLLRRLDRTPEAYAQFRAARDLEPADVRLAYAHAEFLLETGRPEESLAEIEAALRLRPGFPSARRLWAIALAECGRMDEALHYFRRAVVADPTNREARTNLAVALVNAGELEAGLAAYNEALFHAPDDVTLHVQRAMALLKSGRLAEGFAEFEWRVRQPGRTEPPPAARLLPNLADLDCIAGRTVFLIHDEGLGDTLQFMRYANLLVREGARVIAWVPPELARLLRGIAEFAEVLTGEAPLPDFDFHCPFIALPRAFGTTLATIPAEIPYVRADPALAASWRRRLPEPAGGPRIGLVWSGSPRPANRMANLIDRRRSMPFSALAPLASVPDVEFISLQLGARAAEIGNPPPGMRLHDPMGQVQDFADTAAIVANLDALVSVDTSVAHLAGAMGKPVFLLDRHDNCWRWLTGRNDSPWYPGLRIFRQTCPGDWGQPVADVAAALGHARSC